MAEGDDPTANPFIQAINSFQVALQNSPVAEFKSKFAKLQAGDYDEAAVKAQLEDYIAQPAVMFSFTTWPFCIKAKEALDAYGAKYTVVELNEVEGGYPLRAELAAREGRTSVPALYVGGAFVGGCNDGGLW
jgi:glutaredoxin 3